jgi:hypothetical protein
MKPGRGNDFARRRIVTITGDHRSADIHGILSRTPQDQAPHLLLSFTVLPGIMRRVSQNQSPSFAASSRH